MKKLKSAIFFVLLFANTTACKKPPVSDTKETWDIFKNTNMNYGCPEALISDTIRDGAWPSTAYYSIDDNCQNYLGKNLGDGLALEKTFASNPATNLGIREDSVSQCMKGYLNTVTGAAFALPAIIKNAFGNDPKRFSRAVIIDYYFTMNALKVGAGSYLMQIAAIDFELGQQILSPKLAEKSYYGSEFFNTVHPYIKSLQSCKTKTTGLGTLTNIITELLIDYNMAQFRIDRINAIQGKGYKNFGQFYADKPKAEKIVESFPVLFPWIAKSEFDKLKSWQTILGTKDPIFDIKDLLSGKKVYKDTIQNAKTKIFNSLTSKNNEISAAIKSVLLGYRSTLLTRLNEVSEASRCLHSNGFVESAVGTCRKHVQTVLDRMPRWNYDMIDRGQKNSLFSFELSQGQCRIATRATNVDLMRTSVDIGLSLVTLGTSRLGVAGFIWTANRFVNISVKTVETINTSFTYLNTVFSTLEAGSMIKSLNYCYKSFNDVKGMDSYLTRYTTFLSTHSISQCFEDEASAKDRKYGSSNRLTIGEDKNSTQDLLLCTLEHANSLFTDGI